jgi:hypothetical protein
VGGWGFGGRSGKKAAARPADAPWTVPCYLMELDDQRISPAEVEIGKWALCECLLDPRNYVVISMNQLVDGPAIIESLFDEEHGAAVARLVELGRIRVNRFGKYRTALDYLVAQCEREVREADPSKGFVYTPVTRMLGDEDGPTFEDKRLVRATMAKALRSNDLSAFDSPELDFLGTDARTRLKRYLSRVLELSLAPDLYVEPADESKRVRLDRLLPEAVAALGARPDALSRAAAECLGAAFEASGRANMRGKVYHQLKDDPDAGPADVLARKVTDVAYCHVVRSSVAGLEFSRRDFLRDVNAVADAAGRPPRVPRREGKPPWDAALRVSEFALGAGRSLAVRRGFFREGFLLFETLDAFRVLVFLGLFAALSTVFDQLLGPAVLGLEGAWRTLAPVLSAAVSSLLAERLGRLAGSPSYARFRTRLANLLKDAVALRGGAGRLPPGATGLAWGALDLARDALNPAAEAVGDAAWLLRRAFGH